MVSIGTETYVLQERFFPQRKEQKIVLQIVLQKYEKSRLQGNFGLCTEQEEQLIFLELERYFRRQLTEISGLSCRLDGVVELVPLHFMKSKDGNMF